VRLDPQQVDDMVQAVFLALVNDLQGYDARYPLSRFVWLVAQRVCIDEYRKSKAAKRDGEEIPVDHHDGSEAGAAMIASACPTQDRRLQDAEQQELLRASLEHLGEKCADLLRLRYREDLSFKEIADLLGANKKSLAVQAGRCIEELRVIYAQLERTGGKS
jgi:RNA polymerase sigma-70 factor (ECF subfamily)